MLTLALLASLAHATEIGTERKIGAGLESGNGALGLSGKYFLSPSVGVSAGLGNFGKLQQLRLDFEMDIFTLRDEPFGRFDLFWLAGIDTGLYLLPGVTTGRFGVGAGVGLDLKLHDTPCEAFIHIGMGVFPVEYCTNSNSSFCLLAPRGGLGGRYYF